MLLIGLSIAKNAEKSEVFIAVIAKNAVMGMTGGNAKVFILFLAFLAFESFYTGEGADLTV